jgi:hypothetical protein
MDGLSFVKWVRMYEEDILDTSVRIKHNGV